jgi:hypothetical protein
MQTVRYARQRAAWQTARNIRFNFPQRGRHCHVTDSVHQGVICLPLSVGHREWKWAVK